MLDRRLRIGDRIVQEPECFKQWWSWRDVMNNAPRLGIPHFQRGNVWDSANRVALLESMYHKSPCGSIVVWRQGCDRAHPRSPDLKRLSRNPFTQTEEYPISNVQYPSYRPKRPGWNPALQKTPQWCDFCPWRDDLRVVRVRFARNSEESHFLREPPCPL